jgi:hypothetical protein
MRATFTILLPSASPKAMPGVPAKAALTATAHSGLEVANAATVAPMIPARIRAQCAKPTAPRTNSSPPAPAAMTPNRNRR